MQVKLEKEVAQLCSNQTATEAKLRDEVSGARESIAGKQRELQLLELGLNRKRL